MNLSIFLRIQLFASEHSLYLGLCSPPKLNTVLLVVSAARHAVNDNDIYY